jgi:P4 family phage/plasmid primase-like protien
MTAIFGAHAPDHWARGLAVIPLHAHDKRPIPTDWSRFHDLMPTPEEQASWVTHYPDCNMGLVLGRQSGICCIDIDTTDQKAIDTLLAILPKSPWVRIGKKGMVMAYRFTGHRPFRIKDTSGGMIVELLSTKQQVVLPPSIHPDTNKPYVANVPLVEVLGALPELDAQIESILRGALKAAGIEISTSGWTKVTEWTPAGARDVQMTATAGHYANGVLRGELPVIEAIERMKAWYSACTEKIAGDDVNIEKGIQNLIKFIIRDVTERQKVLPKGWDDGLSEDRKKEMGLVFTEDQNEWDYERIKTYLQDQFGLTEPDSSARLAVISNALLKIANGNSLDGLQEERLLRYINEAGGMRMTLAALRKRVKELQEGDLKGTDHAEIARAVIAEFEKVSPLRFWGGDFWEWCGAHWGKVDRVKLMQKITSEFGHLPAAKKAGDHVGIFSTMKNLVPNVLKIQDVDGINFANGVLLLNGQLVPHDPNYGFTYTLPFRYLPDEWGKAHKFQEFLTRAWGKDDDFELKVQALQEAMCTTIFGISTKYQRAFLLQGAPKTGKSQLLQIIRTLVPDQAVSSCPPDTWNDKFAPAMMVGCLLNMCGELSDRKVIDGMRFKGIVAGEEIPAQRKNQQLFHYRPKCAQWFASNHLPRSDDTSAGFTRRWLILTFNDPIQTNEVIIDYGEKIAIEEREAIVAWAVRAMPRLLERNDYTLPPSHIQTVKEVAENNNSVRFFIESDPKVVLAPNLKDSKTWEDEKTLPRISEMMLHNAYSFFCSGAGVAKPVGPRQFRQRMKELAAEMGFRGRINDTASIMGAYEYVGITLADKLSKAA